MVLIGWLACCLASLGSSGTTQSLDPAASRPLDLSDLGAPSFTVFTARDGVPDEAIVSVEADARGFVWLGSASTLARFDGHGWQTLPPLGAKSLVRDLHLDRQGTMWAAFDADGIARYDGFQWQLEDRASGMPTEHIFRIAETRDAHGRDTLWLTTADAGLLRRVDGRWQPDPGNPQLPAGWVVNLVQTHDLLGGPRLWTATGTGGVWFREADGAWQRFQAPGFEVAQVTDLLVSEERGNEELWILTYGGGLWRLTAAGLRVWSAERGELASNQLYSAEALHTSDGDRILWIASRAGLMRLHRDQVQTYDRRHGLPSDAIRGLSVEHSPDGAELLWLATEAGVARAVVNASSWQTASLMGARANGVFNLLLESDDRGGERLWVAATHDGLGLLENGRWRYFNAANGELPSSDMRTVARVANERGVPTLYVGTQGGELLSLDERMRFQPEQTPWPKRAGQAVMHVLGRRLDGQNELWFALRQSGIYRLRNGVWTAFHAADSPEAWRVARLVEHIDGQGKSWLWASTTRGLASFDGDQWNLMGTEQGLPDTDLLGMSLLAEADGRALLWLGSTRHGAIRVDITDPRRPRVVTNDALPEAPDPTVYGVQRDGKGRIYLCTNNGVQQLTQRPEGGYAQRIFRRRDGLVHEECNTNAQLVDAHDRYWIGTLGGLSVYDPNILSVAASAEPKALYLTDVRVNGAGVESSGISLPPGARDLRISYALISWQREDETRYRTHLIGYEAAPGSWTAQNFRDFGGLSPGRYSLSVEARDYAGKLSTGLNVPIEVLPAWWQRRSIQALAVLAALLGVVASVQWRVRSLRAQKRHLQAEVAARTAELNAANLSLIGLSYLDPLTGMANRRRLMEGLQASWAAALAKQRLMAVIVVDLDHFKAYNDCHGHLAGDVALRTVAEAMRAASGPGTLVARYGGEEFACIVDNAGLEEAMRIAERMRAAVAAAPLSTPSGQGTSITLSAGVAARIPSASDRPDDLLREADAALYRAKNEGRNRVVCAAVSVAGSAPQGSPTMPA